LITAAGLWFISQFFHERYTIWGLPPFLILADCGLAGLSRFVYRRLATLSSPQLSNAFAQVVAVGLVGLLLSGLLGTSLYRTQQYPAIKQTWPLGRLQEAAELIMAQARPGEAIILINLPQLHAQFFTEQKRPDLIYVDSSVFSKGTDKLAGTLTGRWYVLHDHSYTTPKRPAEWLDSKDYHEFHDIVVIHLATPCPMRQCIYETKTLLQQMIAANPDSRLTTAISKVVTGLERLGF
jgi:hypothetical protein